LQIHFVTGSDRLEFHVSPAFDAQPFDYTFPPEAVKFLANEKRNAKMTA
jgi:hypothetical protein